MTFTLDVPAEPGKLSIVRRFVAQTAHGFCQDEDYIYDLVLVVDEAVTNIMVHGYSQVQSTAPGNIQITIEPVAGGLAVTIQDDAPWFDPTTYPAPDFTQPLELRKRGGLGIHLVRQLTEELEYQAVPTGGNQLRMVKRFPAT